MALTDPQSIDVGAGATSLPRTNSGNNSAEYRSADGSTKLSLSHAYGRRNREVVRVDHKKLTADPFIPDVDREVSMSCYIVFDRPAVGYTNAEALDIWQGLAALAAASSDALVVKLLGGES